MKSCPTCNKTFTDPNLSFCIDDGTPLVSVAEPPDETTVVSPSLGDTEHSPPPTEVYKPRDWQAPDYQPPGFQTPTAAPTGKKTWPWVVGLVAVLGIGMIAIAIGGILLLKALRPESSSSNRSIERSGDSNSNLNSNEPVANSNAPVANSNNQNSDTPIEKDDLTQPPTDKDVVLATLKDLEQEWTVANINADKKKLNRILADDYVAKAPDGKVLGKAEYLRIIERDTTIQNWKFEGLKVNLMGDRATLEGVIHYQLPNGEAPFRFMDKFVWRDGRWQAVGSEVSRIE